jgi:hypothetical protein
VERFPAFVKPSEEHSSFGITRDSVVFTPDEVRARVAFLLNEFKGPVLVMDYLAGREFNVAIWGNGVPEILPIHELDFSFFADPRDRLCSFDASGARLTHGKDPHCARAGARALRATHRRGCAGAYQSGAADYGASTCASTTAKCMRWTSTPTAISPTLAAARSAHRGYDQARRHTSSAGRRAAPAHSARRPCAPTSTSHVRRRWTWG